MVRHTEAADYTLARGAAVPREEIDTMQLARAPRSRRVRFAALVLVAMALLVPGGSVAQASGLTNCTTGLLGTTGPSAGLTGCWENVWVDGVQYRMTFFGASKPWKGSVPMDKLAAFYVVGPQSDSPQSLNSPFVHDHVVAALPRQNGGAYTPVYEGILVVCSSAGCVSSTSGLATTVNGGSLKSVEAIGTAAGAGLVALVPAGVVLGTLGSR